MGASTVSPFMRRRNCYSNYDVWLMPNDILLPLLLKLDYMLCTWRLTLQILISNFLARDDRTEALLFQPFGEQCWVHRLSATQLTIFSEVKHNISCLITFFTHESWYKNKTWSHIYTF